MTGQEIIDAWEHWLLKNPETLVAESWVRSAFLAGIEAAESIWRDVPGEKVTP